MSLIPPTTNAKGTPSLETAAREAAFDVRPLLFQLCGQCSPKGWQYWEFLKAAGVEHKYILSGERIKSLDDVQEASMMLTIVDTRAKSYQVILLKGLVIDLFGSQDICSQLLRHCLRNSQRIAVVY